MRFRRFSLDSFADLAEFIADKRIVFVSIGVELGKDSESLFLLAVRDKPSRTLGDDEEADDLQSWKEDLQEKRHSP